MPHYYSEKNVELVPEKIKVRVWNRVFDFWSGSGVFSRERLDKGTEALILAAEVKKDQKILDLGCGYGVVGVLLAKEYGINPDFLDINPNAIKLTRMNMKEFNVKGRTKKSDLYEKAEVYDVILCNPPYVAGREVCSKIITEAPKYLNKGGSLQIVARYQKGGKYFEKLMEETFGNVETLLKKSGYRVFKSVK